LILSIQRDEFGLPITLADQPDLLDIEGFYRRGAGNFWVALAAARVVGSVGLLDIGNRQGALRKMFVAAPFRGRALGVARRLLDGLLDWAAERGMTEIFLGTTESFRAAHRFYERSGFAEVARSALPAAFPVMAVDSKFYRLEIGRPRPER
jgi:GNAT superfamily N-acetyltransferase